MLCDSCLAVADLVYNDPDFDTDLKNPTLLHPSFTAFRNAAQAGCQFCVHTWTAFSKRPPLELAELPDDTLEPALQVRFYHSTLGAVREHKHLRFSFTKVEGFANWMNRVPPSLRESLSEKLFSEPLYLGAGATFTNQPKTFEGCTSRQDYYAVLVKQIKKWLEADRESQSEPNGHFGKAVAFRPTRMIKIADDGLSISLVQATSLPHEVEYLALSHRWSDDPNSFMCIKSTLDSLKDGIPVTRLSRTIREAISVASDIGFSYMWIDHLCIVQDDRQDWETESITMEMVYSNAECTLAANTTTRDADASFLEPVLDSLRKRTMPSGIPYTTSFTGPDDLIYLASLSHRGWCLQERLLAKRMIHFVESDVAFESRIKDDSWPGNIPTAMIPTGEGQRGILPGRNFTKGSLQVDYIEPEILSGGRSRYEKTVLGGWFRIVVNFRCRNLTYESDRLIAIDAVVSKIRAKTGWTYYHGVWAEAAPQCLLWYAGNNIFGRETTPLADADKYPVPSGVQFPTWSWASCNNMVLYNVHGQIRKRTNLVAALPIYRSAKPMLDMYGQLLVIKACTRNVYPPRHGINHDPEILALNAQIQPYLQQLYPDRPADSAGVSTNSPAETSLLRFLPDSRLFDPTRSDMYFVPVVAGLGVDSEVDPRGRDASDYNTLVTTGLVLRKSVDVPDAYIRVGIAHHHGEKIFESTPLLDMGERVVKHALDNGVSFKLV